MPDASISLSSGTTTEAQFRVLALPESALAVMIRENLYGEVIKVHAALESASSQLAQHPTTGLFFVNDHIQKSAPVVIQKAEILTQQQHMCKLSKDQAEEATVTVKLLRASGASVRYQRIPRESLPGLLPEHCCTAACADKTCSR
ncbi:hypothetical protein ABBQ38_002722 [Trebouxia sp. C0009 RCD-2024]